jgi:hypothetical protein
MLKLWNLEHMWTQSSGHQRSGNDGRDAQQRGGADKYKVSSHPTVSAVRELGCATLCNYLAKASCGLVNRTQRLVGKRAAFETGGAPFSGRLSSTERRGAERNGGSAA